VYIVGSYLELPLIDVLFIEEYLLLNLFHPMWGILLLHPAYRKDYFCCIVLQGSFRQYPKHLTSIGQAGKYTCRLGPRQH